MLIRAVTLNVHRLPGWLCQSIKWNLATVKSQKEEWSARCYTSPSAALTGWARETHPTLTRQSEEAVHRPVEKLEAAWLCSVIGFNPTHTSTVYSWTSIHRYVRVNIFLGQDWRGHGVFTVRAQTHWNSLPEEIRLNNVTVCFLIISQNVPLPNGF